MAAVWLHCCGRWIGHGRSLCSHFAAATKSEHRGAVDGLGGRNEALFEGQSVLASLGGEGAPISWLEHEPVGACMWHWKIWWGAQW